MINKLYFITVLNVSLVIGQSIEGNKVKEQPIRGSQKREIISNFNLNCFKLFTIAPLNAG